MSLIASPTNAIGTDVHELPWPALTVLGAATLTMVTGEMLPTAVLEQMSTGLGVSEARVGLLVSVWAATVVLASFPLVRLASRFDRRTVITAGLWVFAGSAGITALAPSYEVALAGRTLGAGAVGLLWASVNAHVADLVPEGLLGRATAVVLGGATLGMVLGTPLGRFVADVAGWRAAFWLLAIASAVTAGFVERIVPAAPRREHRDPTGGDRPLRPVLVVTGLVAVGLAGHYGAYTYITRLAEPGVGRVPGGMGMVLLTFGLASAAGVALAGRVARTAPAIAVAMAATAVLVLALRGAGANPVLGLAIVAAWGAASGALAPLAQTEILRLAGPQHRSLAGALIPVLFNGGIAVGAALASITVDRAGVDALPLPAALVAAASAAALATVTRPVGDRSA